MCCPDTISYFPMSESYTWLFEVEYHFNSFLDDHWVDGTELWKITNISPDSTTYIIKTTFDGDVYTITYDLEK